MTEKDPMRTTGGEAAAIVMMTTMMIEKRVESMDLETGVRGMSMETTVAFAGSITAAMTVEMVMDDAGVGKSVRVGVETERGAAIVIEDIDGLGGRPRHLWVVASHHQLTTRTPWELNGPLRSASVPMSCLILILLGGVRN